MDHMMPDMDGIEAVHIIREEIGTDYAKNIPIIALTANAILGNEDMFLNSGFQAFIPKPIDIMRLDAVINKWIRDKSQEKIHDRSKGHVHRMIENRSDVDRRSLRDRRIGRDRRSRDFRAAPKAPAQGAPILGEINGIDVYSGMERLGNDEDVYVKVLRSYLQNTPGLLDKMEAHLMEDNLHDYAIVVHGIKSSSRTVGAGGIGARAEALEHAAKANDAAFVKRHNDGFVRSLRDLIENAASSLQNLDEIRPKPLRSEPDKEVLDKLAEACLIYDNDAVDEALQELESYHYESGEELITWIRERASQFAFKQIAERLKED
jgi:CheY-like chemotaxis protein